VNNDTQDKIGAAVVFLFGVILARALPGVSVWAWIGGLFLYCVVVLLNEWRRERKADRERRREMAAFEERRAAGLNGEFHDAPEGDTRGRGVIK
jgi:hypothetical protein